MEGSKIRNETIQTARGIQDRARIENVNIIYGLVVDVHRQMRDINVAINMKTLAGIEKYPP